MYLERRGLLVPRLSAPTLTSLQNRSPVCLNATHQPHYALITEINFSHVFPPYRHATTTRSATHRVIIRTWVIGVQAIRSYWFGTWLPLLCHENTPLELFTRQNTPPQLMSGHAIPQTQEIKEIAAALPRMAIPTQPTRYSRCANPERRARIFPVVMMPAKRTASHATPI
jgi:hypothetical protein